MADIDINQLLAEIARRPRKPRHRKCPPDPPDPALILERELTATDRLMRRRPAGTAWGNPTCSK
ncbi:hypothetical protein MAGR_09020 [Mycolicibacterium agri]|uniref:Uncharacterized protein n=1 Tax=Mycolicibacterium agri TaxID=36811 RepID=A0A7I9VVJ8_MYCAG|nr:hypothetical protein MAGR_09020 [Mycolicibacterium agri]